MNKINQFLTTVTLLLLSNVSIALEVEAVTAWANRVEVGSQVTGVVTVVNVSAGQQVKKDELLLQLDQRYFTDKYSKTRAQLVSDKETMIEAKRELDRSLDLYEQTILAEHELQMAKNAHKKAVADYRNAVAENTRARMQLEYSSFKAPFDAVIIKVLKNVGESVNARTETPLMLVIAEAGKMKATAMVSADSLAEIKTGQAAKVTVAGQSYNGKVKNVGLEPEAASGLYKLDVEFTTTAVIPAGSKASINL